MIGAYDPLARVALLEKALKDFQTDSSARLADLKTELETARADLATAEANLVAAYTEGFFEGRGGE